MTMSRFKELSDRHANDPVFHQMASNFKMLLACGTVTKEDVLDALEFAEMRLMHEKAPEPWASGHPKRVT